MALAQKWLEERVGAIRYDGKALTKEKLQLAIRSYYALRRIVDERKIDFIGVKAQTGAYRAIRYDGPRRGLP